MNEFKLKAPYKPTGDQPQAIAELVKGFKEGNQCQTLLGVTGSGKTFTMANVIQKNTGGDLFAIQPAESYGDDFNTVADKALSDQQNGVLPELSDHIANLDQYDTIFVGYPIWWYDMPQLMYSFFSEYDLSGKTIIPFNSHGGSGFSGSVEEIEELEPNATVRTDGLTLSRSVVADSENRIVTWLETIGLKKSA